jgi:hypothetical protein
METVLARHAASAASRDADATEKNVLQDVDHTLPECLWIKARFAVPVG